MFLCIGMAWLARGPSSWELWAGETPVAGRPKRCAISERTEMGVGCPRRDSVTCPCSCRSWSIGEEVVEHISWPGRVLPGASNAWWASGSSHLFVLIALFLTQYKNTIKNSLASQTREYCYSVTLRTDHVHKTYPTERACFARRYVFGRETNTQRFRCALLRTDMAIFIAPAQALCEVQFTYI